MNKIKVKISMGLLDEIRRQEQANWEAEGLEAGHRDALDAFWGVKEHAPYVFVIISLAGAEWCLDNYDTWLAEWDMSQPRRGVGPWRRALKRFVASLSKRLVIARRI